jgi:peptidoglycan/xylan/chitin deacetylase (PgdA/CDA1 family)
MTNSRRFRQVVIGLLALPLSILPFLAYLTWTPEGRLVRDRALVAVNPPVLPSATGAQIARGDVPAYEGAVMVLAYHGLGSASDAEGGFVLSPDRFGEHLVALRAAGMTTVTAAQVADAFLGGNPLPPKALMITFDDGRADAMMFADPLLEQAGMKATMFVITGAAENPGLYYAGWDRLEKAAASGRWDLQSHTDALHDLQKVDGRELPLMTSLKKGESLGRFRTRIDRDLTRADRALTKHAGVKPVALAYPFGAYGADRRNNAGVRNALSGVVSRHQQLGFQQDDQQHMTLATPYDDRSALRRLEVGDWTAPQLMRRIASAAARTSKALDARTTQLQADVALGQPIPSGLVESPVTPPAPVIVPRTARSSATSRSAAGPSPATQSAAPATPVTSPPSGGSTPTPTPTSPPQTTPTTRPPRSTPPTTSAPPPTSPPATSAPGKSGDPHGNGKNNNN